jgi:hypothetical protein
MKNTLLCISLLLLVSCGQKITSKSLVGKWNVTQGHYYQFNEDGSFSETDDFGSATMTPITTSGTYEVVDKKAKPMLILKGRGPWHQYFITQFNAKTMVLQSYSGNIQNLTKQ